MSTAKKKPLLVNLLNREDVASWVERLAAKHKTNVQAWCASTLDNWLQTHESGCTTQCVDSEVASSPVYRMLQVLVMRTDEGEHHMYHEVERATLPVWAQTVLDSNRLYYWLPPEDTAVISHWLDYMAILPDKQIRMTVAQVLLGVTVWDKQLARQKVLSSLAEGVMACSASSLAGHAEGKFYVVKLLTKAAYAAEGAVMKNCVSGYFGRKETVYSLRSFDQGTPVATIEVSSYAGSKFARPGMRVMQVKEWGNRAPSEETLVALRLWASDREIAISLNASGHGLYDDNDCEDEEDEEDCEDGEDEEDCEDEEDNSW